MLREARLQLGPLVRRYDARDRVERDQPLGAGTVAVHGERDPDAAEREVRLGALTFDPLGRLVPEPVVE